MGSRNIVCQHFRRVGRIHCRIGLDKDTSHRHRRNHCSYFPDGNTSHQKSEISDAIQ